MKPLRAFLFACDAYGEWTSTVFREWEPLLEATTTVLVSQTGCAAIHIGFWRPHTDQVADLARPWSNRVLLSESALGALPPPIAVSRNSVGEVEGLRFYLALNGFGYRIEDLVESSPPTKITETEPSNEESKSVPRHQGWVKELLQMDPRIVGILTNASIWDDESYHDREPTLKTVDRLDLALARYRAIVGSPVNRSNILNNLRACPRWFLEENLHRFDLTVRQRNVCVAAELRTVGDLVEKGYNGLLKLPNFGRGSITRLEGLLYEAFILGNAIKRNSSIGYVREQDSEGEGDEPTPLETKTEQPPHSKNELADIKSGFGEAAKLLTENERGIWAARMGYRTKILSLQEIANDIGLTRERVRQLEVKIYSKLKRHPFWEILSKRLHYHLLGRTNPLLLDGLSAIDPWFKDVEQLRNPLAEVFDHLLDNEYSILEIGNTPVITRITQKQWDNNIVAAKSLLHDQVGQKTSEDRLRLQVHSLINGPGSELCDELWSLVKNTAMWSADADGIRFLAGYGRSAEAVVYAVLESSDQPLHYSEIFRRSRLLTDREFDERRIHSAAQTVGVLFGRGTYGLRSHCPLSREQLALIEAEVDDIAAGTAPTKQWHASELLEELQDRGLDFDGQLTKYIINLALSTSKTFANMRRMVWGYKESWEASAASRLDTIQAVLSLLEAAGRPLSIVEIKEQLEAERGLNSHFQIHAQGNLVRVGAGLWGLADRDVKFENTDDLFNKVIEHMRRTQEGVHISEVSSLLGGIDDEKAQALMGLAARYGLRRDRSQYIYLAEWDNSRRVWPNVAVSRVLKNHQGGVSIEAIRREVAVLTKRELKPVAISHLLIHHDGAKYDPDLELWSLENTDRSENDEGMEGPAHSFH